MEKEKEATKTTETPTGEAKEEQTAKDVAAVMSELKTEYEKQIEELKKQISENEVKHAETIKKMLLGEAAEKEKAKKRGDDLADSVNRVRAALGLKKEENKGEQKTNGI